MPGLSIGALGGVRGFAKTPTSAPVSEQAFGSANSVSASDSAGSAPDPLPIFYGVTALGALILWFVWYTAPA